MEKTLKFYLWFVAIGGGIYNHQLESIDKTINNIPLQFSSSLKNRATEIKEKHNYKFNFKRYNGAKE